MTSLPQALHGVHPCGANCFGSLQTAKSAVLVRFDPRNDVILAATASLSARTRRRRPWGDRSRRARRELTKRDQGERVRCARGKRQPPRQQLQRPLQLRAAMAILSSNVSSDRAPPRVPFAPGRMRRRSKPRDRGRPAIRSASQRRLVPRGRKRRRLRVPKDPNVAGASARHPAEISRQAAKLRSPPRRESALGRCPWRSIDRRIEKPRARQWRQGPLMPRLAPESCSRRHSRRNDCKEQQARSRRPSGVAFRLRLQAHRRQQAPSRGGRRSTPCPTRFLRQGAAPAAHSKALRSAHGQRTVRVGCAPSHPQICRG